MVRVWVGGLVSLACTGLAVLPASAAERQRFICRADQAIGFGSEAETWKPATPDVSDRMYVISPLEVFDGRYAVVRLGEKAPLYYCEPGGADRPNILACGMNKLDFVIDIGKGRYQRLQSHGYVDEPVPPETGPGIEIGRCFSFQ